MKKGFTLLELIVVLIIIGILAALGLGQFLRMIEKSRGAEARNILGMLRTTAAAFYMEQDGTGALTAALSGIGTTNDKIPGATAAQCRATHYFFYALTANDATSTTYRARRCIVSGRPPQAATADDITLQTFHDGSAQDIWATTGGY